MNMKKIFKTLLLLNVLLLASNLIDYSFSQIKSIEAWDTPEKVKHFKFETTRMDTVFPAPALLPEPEYSLNDTNTVKWNKDSIYIKLQESNAGSSIILFEVQALYNNNELWGYVEPECNSATFINLPTGVRIRYRLRYIGMDSSGNYGLSYWSEPEMSIQDKNPPSIHQLTIIDLQQGENENWLLGNTVNFHIIASDSVLGKVEKICIQESSSFIQESDTILIESPATSINRQYSFSLQTPEQESLSLIFWVIDRAGRNSAVQEYTLFWMPSSSEMFCFPNPFNPKKDQRTMIKIEDQNIEEVRIYDLFGNLIRRLSRTPGSYFFEWDGRNGKNEMVSTGGYICIVPGSKDLYCKIAVIR